MRKFSLDSGAAQNSEVIDASSGIAHASAFDGEETIYVVGKAYAEGHSNAAIAAYDITSDTFSYIKQFLRAQNYPKFGCYCICA